MHQVTEFLIAERVVAEILDDGASVGIGVSLLKLGFGEVGKFSEEEGADGLLPGEVDELLMGLNRVGDGGNHREKQGEQRYCFEESAVEMGANGVCPFLLLCCTLTLYIAWRREERGRLVKGVADAVEVDPVRSGIDHVRRR